MQDFDKLGVFYLGRLYDLQNKKGLEELLLYDSKDLVTHAVCNRNDRQRKNRSLH